MGNPLTGEGSDPTIENSGPGTYGHVDPNGLQTSGTVAGAAAVAVLLADSGTGENVGSFLNLGTRIQEVATAGLTLHSLANLGLFSLGILLIVLCVLLNIASLTIRWQHALSMRRYEEERARVEAARRERRSVLESGTASSRAQEPYPLADQNRRR